MKHKTKTRQTLLREYSLLATSLAVFSPSIGQVIYTDIDPDKSYGYQQNQQIFSLDLDGEPWGDIILHADRYSESEGGGFYITQVINTVFLSMDPSNFIIASSTSDGSQLPKPVIFGEIIDHYDIWKNDERMALARSRYDVHDSEINMQSAKGLWLNGITDGYLGFKMVKSGADYYGWLRLDVDSTNCSITVKDYAFNATPNDEIFAGQTETLIEQASIYFINNQLIINEWNSCVIELIAISGQITHRQEISARITTLPNIIRGMYIARILKDGELVHTMKIII